MIEAGVLERGEKSKQLIWGKSCSHLDCPRHGPENRGLTSVSLFDSFPQTFLVYVILHFMCRTCRPRNRKKEKKEKKEERGGCSM